MKTDEIRERFLRFFEARGHKVVSSDSLVPAKDPSVLFTGAGMNQFKEQFMGRNITYRRAASSQKCLRTADLENVGKTPGHHTFFEMLGNFSFGDYFKKEAIAWAWEFMTKELGLPAGRMSVSVYEEDIEAYQIWAQDISIPAGRIKKMGDKENFWPAEAKKYGPNGPCGPCSEIYYEPDGVGPLEVWNLVFTQFERRDGGALTDLPGRNIDTGMGLERLASVMQGVGTNFEIDIFIPIVRAIKQELSLEPRTYNLEPRTPRPASYPTCRGGYNLEPRTYNLEPNINAIADHIRAAAFAISDGIYPSNEERGFVVRKLIRRALQRGLAVKKLKRPFLYKLAPVVAGVMKGPYPELEKKREDISRVIKGEEERFLEIMLEVVPLMKEEFEAVKKSGAAKIDGELVFKYSDEKGVPLDLQKEVAAGMGLEIDEEGFSRFLKVQKERSRSKSKISKQIFAAPAGLARKKDEEWSEDEKRRIRENHTATHLLHAALRRVLGEHALQSGSLVYPDRLRFDFTHPGKLKKDEIAKVEGLVNENIAASQEVKKDIMPLEDAKRQGAVALFGEKYGDEVTVRTIGDFSKELCGGEHVNNTKEIRLFKITQEGSVSAGTRRIEALTGDAVYEWMSSQDDNIKSRIADSQKGLERSSALNKKAEQIIKEMDEKTAAKNYRYDDIKNWEARQAQAQALIEEMNAEKKRIEKAQIKEGAQGLGPLIEELIKTARPVAGVNIIARMLTDKDMAALRILCDGITGRASCAVLLGSAGADKANLVLALSRDLVERGLNARELIRPIAACVGGSGGGRPEFAQAGGKEVSRLKEAVAMIDNIIKEKLS